MFLLLMFVASEIWAGIPNLSHIFVDQMLGCRRVDRIFVFSYRGNTGYGTRTKHPLVVTLESLIRLYCIGTQPKTQCRANELLLCGLCSRALVQYKHTTCTRRVLLF